MQPKCSAADNRDVESAARFSRFFSYERSFGIHAFSWASAAVSPPIHSPGGETSGIGSVASAAGTWSLRGVRASSRRGLVDQRLAYHVYDSYGLPSPFGGTIVR